MSVTQIHRSKQPRRPHYVVEWAKRRGFKKAVDLAKEINADKSVVSRWYNGATPGKEYQDRLAAAFGIEPDALFRHPDDDWIARFLAGRDEEEIERIKATLESAFPRRMTG